MGNICRSPMAEAVFRQMVKDASLENSFEIASAGTDSWHVGEPPHPGTLAILRQKSIDPGNKRAHQLSQSDMQKYDYIIAMDSENVNTLEKLVGRRTAEHQKVLRGRIVLLAATGKNTPEIAKVLDVSLE